VTCTTSDGECGFVASQIFRISGSKAKSTSCRSRWKWLKGNGDLST
jgi:hypothetical protein